MLDRITPVFPNERRCLDTRQSLMHDESLEGVPPGSTITAEINGISGVIRSMAADSVKVKIVTPLGGVIESTIPKSVFVKLPPERRSIDIRREKPAVEAGNFNITWDFDPDRASKLNLAVHLAAHPEDEETNMKNPFRAHDNEHVGETLAIIADNKNAGLYAANRWKSHLQSPDDVKTVFKPGELGPDCEGGLKIDEKKLVSVDHDEYRSRIRTAVARLLTKKNKLRGEGDYPIS